MPTKLSDSFFGSIALKNRMLSREQLTQALRVQWERTREGAGPNLGEVCRLLGFLRDEEVNAILWAQAKSEVLLEDSLTGKICLKNKLVSKAQLDEALEDQRALDFTVRLGDLLCERGYLDRQQLHAVLKAQSRMKSNSQRLKPVIVPPARKAARPTISAPANGKAPASGKAPIAAPVTAPKPAAKKAAPKKSIAKKVVAKKKVAPTSKGKSRSPK